MLNLSKIITAILCSLSITIGIGVLLLVFFITQPNSFIVVVGSIFFGVIIITMGLLPILGVKNEML